MTFQINTSVCKRLSVFILISLCIPMYLFSQTSCDSISNGNKNIYRLNVGFERGMIFHTNSFLKGNNQEGRTYNGYSTINLGASFQIPENTVKGKIYGAPYQGIGISKFFMSNNKEMGSPIAAYFFQGADIKKYSERLKLTYEWNFGLSFDWKPFDINRNKYNSVIGSRVNAYINAGAFLNLLTADGLWFKVGPTLTHFSNGNTKFPNAGLNLLGLKASAVYDVNHKEVENKRMQSNSIIIPKYKSFIDYELLFFGSWRRGIVIKNSDSYTSDGPYGVAGITFAPMYNINYRYRVGASIDLVYDSSLGTYVMDAVDNSGNPLFGKGKFFDNVAVGLSLRAEYVMPYFTISTGFGYNVIDSGRDSRGTYQIAAIKHYFTKGFFVNVGYKLKDFQNPNFLMFGLGFRFK